MKMKSTVIEDREIDFPDRFDLIFKYFESCDTNEIWEKRKAMNDELYAMWKDLEDYCYENDIVSIANGIGEDFFE